MSDDYGPPCFEPSCPCCVSWSQLEHQTRDERDHARKLADERAVEILRLSDVLERNRIPNE